MSRLKQQTRQSLTITLAVVDANKIDGVTWGQLADYLCMVTLSRPHLGATFGPSTIMSLFAMRDSGRAPPRTLTKLDMSTLRNMYAIESRFSATKQRRILRTKVVDDLNGD
jgi:hypothetical protein